ncbi:GIY-YIG nuclease family protein, partial [Desulfovibrio sp. 1214_IL3152]
MTSDPWLVYLLECADGTLYCGITRDMERRLAQHNGALAGGARYTR